MKTWTSIFTLVALVALSACGIDDGKGGEAQPDGSAPPAPTTPPDGSVDAGRTSCLDRPNQLSRPPGDRLPCELIPPGVTL